MKMIAIVALVLLLAACGSFGQAGETPNIPGPASEEDGPKGPSKEAVLIYSRSGGFAGLSETWNFYLDGRIVSDGGEEKQVSAAAMQALMEQLQQADLAAMKDMTLESSGCADCFQIELALNTGEEQVRLSVVPESQDADPAAVALVDAVQALLSAAE